MNHTQLIYFSCRTIQSVTHTPEIFHMIQSNCNINGGCDSRFSLKRMNEWKTDGWTELGRRWLEGRGFIEMKGPGTDDD